MPSSTHDTSVEAGPSRSGLVPGPSPYHESSQFIHWRYSPSKLSSMRSNLNSKSVEVARRNTELEKEAQISLGHDFQDPPPPAVYLTVDDELLLLRFYCSQITTVCRHGFGLPDIVETTAISYLKRFYLKNSVMEWHPKVIMPTCLFLAAKTTNYPVLVDQFISKFSKLTTKDVLEKEFLVAQSLGFEFWVRSSEKSLRGWSLEMQKQPTPPPMDVIQKTISAALGHLSTSLFTDAEFIFSPSQISLACLHLANQLFVEDFLDQRYEAAATASSKVETTVGDAGDEGSSQEVVLAFGIPKDRLMDIVAQVEVMVLAVSGEIDLKRVKEVDRRLKQCTNPEKVPGTALYLKRKQEKEQADLAAKANKSLKTRGIMPTSDISFGEVLSAP
ncbi:hypothetical protein IAT38_006717 [Cryptococcus sp. DSM 104549]